MPFRNGTAQRGMWWLVFFVILTSPPLGIPEIIFGVWAVAAIGAELAKE